MQLLPKASPSRCLGLSCGVAGGTQGGSRTQLKGVPRRFTPILTGVREEVQEGSYTLVPPPPPPRGGPVHTPPGSMRPWMQNLPHAVRDGAHEPAGV